MFPLVRMNETDMIPHIIEIFWIEKLRYTQYCFQQIGKISELELEHSGPDRTKSIIWAVEQMAAFDRNFAFYLPISILFSSLFFIGTIEERDVEEDIEGIRDKYTPPAFPIHFLDIQISSARDLKINTNGTRRDTFLKEWQLTLIKIEEKLHKFSENDAFKKRYTSLTGIHTIPGAINNSTEFCHKLWNHHVAPYLKPES
ncbi:hypothetical protein EHQ58_03285 [Leptospira ognonensis]|uniref:Uncharacterized protein n=2 Tax=Leptospira ognonensis TaxID=2484945 RepID=A0A4V6QM81_9LEPT|nr:hypothetical protein EHQ58_03285 [Leptospira ognonensis]